MLARFSNVAGHSGVFFRGASPMWIWNARGRVSLTPMSVDHPMNGLQSQAMTNNTKKKMMSQNQTAVPSKVPVLGWTAFHHWNCPQGFMYFHSDGMLRVCEWPAQATLISPECLVQKISMHATVHHVAYVPCYGSGAVQDALKIPTYVVVVSKMVEPHAVLAKDSDDAQAGTARRYQTI
jgi:cleavage and polyadenylation specificity factor subunit 1